MKRLLLCLVALLLLVPLVVSAVDKTVTSHQGQNVLPHEKMQLPSYPGYVADDLSTTETVVKTSKSNFGDLRLVTYERNVYFVDRGAGQFRNEEPSADGWVTIALTVVMDHQHYYYQEPDGTEDVPIEILEIDGAGWGFEDFDLNRVRSILLETKGSPEERLQTAVNYVMSLSRERPDVPSGARYTKTILSQPTWLSQMEMKIVAAALL